MASFTIFLIRLLDDVISATNSISIILIIIIYVSFYNIIVCHNKFKKKIVCVKSRKYINNYSFIAITRI